MGNKLNETEEKKDNFFVYFFCKKTGSCSEE